MKMFYQDSLRKDASLLMLAAIFAPAFVIDRKIRIEGQMLRITLASD